MGYNKCHLNENWCESSTSATSLENGYFDDGNQVLSNLNNLSVDFMRGFGRMFYIVSPGDSSFENVDDVPTYFRQAWPYFLLFIFVENLILWIDRQPTLRVNDGLTSISHGLIQETGRLLFRGAETCAYIYIYENFRLVDLPWNYPSTWYLAAICVDFGYYWMHRACHEVMILWAQHQVHHSSEEFNLAVGLRQSFLQGWCGFLFYLPLALAIPPAQFITHQEFLLLYQFWIHTKAVRTLGPFEYIFNTPNHHRVHHGSNLYCLDKNYGGVLIIWDYIFGTFAIEKNDEEIIYGLVVNQPTFNPLYLQAFYTNHVIAKCKSMKTWKLKLASVFCGPSWLPGRPRLGVDEDKIKGMNPLSVMGFACYIIASLTVIGMLFDNKPNARVLELIRCVLVVFSIHILDFPGTNNILVLATQLFFSISGVFWFLQTVNVLEITTTNKLL